MILYQILPVGTTYDSGFVSRSVLNITILRLYAKIKFKKSYLEKDPTFLRNMNIEIETPFVTEM